MKLTYEQISDSTGFDAGDRFYGAKEVYEYFTPEAQAEAFGDAATTDRETLNAMADEVIANRWHMSRGDNDPCGPSGNITEVEAWKYARDNQGYSGTIRDWLDMGEMERAEYESGASGTPTA